MITVRAGRESRGALVACALAEVPGIGTRSERVGQRVDPFIEQPTPSMWLARRDPVSTRAIDPCEL